MVHIFIINPMAGWKNFADSLRNQISKLPDIEYYIFDTRSAGYEATLIRKIQHIFEDEKLRIYCCGGSGTFKNIVNDIDNLDNVEVAFFPCGNNNEFLRTFKKEDFERFFNIEELVNGDVIDVDYIRYNGKGICLNSFSTGLDTKFIEKYNEYKFLRTYGRKIPVFIAIIAALFKTHPLKCEVSAGDRHYVDDFTEVYFGNGSVVGTELHVYEHPNTNDGVGKFMLLRQDARKFWSIPVAISFMKRKPSEIELVAEYGDAQSIYIRRIDDGPVAYNVDGELETFGGTVKLEMVKGGLHFVVPKGVKAADGK